MGQLQDQMYKESKVVIRDVTAAQFAAQAVGAPFEIGIRYRVDGGSEYRWNGSEWIATAESAVDLLTGRIKNPTAGGIVMPLRNQVETLSVGVLGDSISKMCFDYSTGYGAVAGDASLSSYGWATWWQFFAKSNINFEKYAVSGSASSDVINNQLAAALSAGHDIYTLAPIGINDVVSGDETVENITTIVETVVKAGKRMLLGTPTPTDVFATSKGRIAIIMAGMRTLAAKYPAQVRLADFNRLASNPSDPDGAAYQTTIDDGTYDTTHPSWLMAVSMGAEAHRVTSDWTAPYIFPVTRGDSGNMLPNGQFGGATGAITSAGANSVAPDGWTASRGAATVTYSAFKARRLPLMWKTATTYPIGARIVPPIPTGFHYIVLSPAPTGATVPSAATLFGQSTPDAGGPVYLTVPANDTNGVPEIGEDWLLLGSSTAMTAADHCGLSNAAIDATGMVGKRVKIGLFLESLGSICPLLQLRVEQFDAANARIIGAFGMAANSLPGSPLNPYASLGRGKKGLIATPAFTVAANCTQLRIYIRAYQPGNGYQTVIALSDGFICEVE